MNQKNFTQGLNPGTILVLTPFKISTKQVYRLYTYLYHKKSVKNKKLRTN